MVSCSFIHSMYDMKSCVMVNQQMSDTYKCNMLSTLMIYRKKKLIEYNCNYLYFYSLFLKGYLNLLVLMYADDTVLVCVNEANMKY